MKRINRNLLSKLILNAFFALTILILSGASAQAQHGYRLEKPLKFAAGKSVATVKGRIAEKLEAHEYKFKAKRGQILHIRLVAPNKEMIFVVQNADDEPIEGFTLTGEPNQMSELPADGEYKINVSANRGKGNYTLSVELKDN